MPKYIAITFSPVQSFIEKSRKLRDLYGASQILSDLTSTIVNHRPEQYHLISPGLLNSQQGMPNRVLLKVDSEIQSSSSEEIIAELQRAFLNRWKNILATCRKWVENALAPYYRSSEWNWQKSWKKWEKRTWEFFWGMGDNLESAMVDLENRKLARNWQGVNWVGESSSLSGTDAIAWYGMDRENQDMKTLDWSEENRHIALFYRRLAFLLDGVNDPDGQPKDKQPEGKYIDGNERLNIPELTKRLITLPHIARSLGVELPEELRQRGFRDLIRRPQDNPASVGQKTGWFMGDGDKVGDYLKDLGSDQKIRDFSKIMRQWGQQFQRDFNQTELGRIIYAGGDDFLGIVYNSQFPDPQLDSIEIDRVFHWLQTLDQQWKTGKTEEINQRVTLSLGFVWAAHSIPQRDVLQHCREAEQRSKKLGRDRLTIRVLFNNGQYVQWTTRWKYLNTLNHYRDRDGGKNWGHIYSDFARLKARHAFGLGYLDNPRSHSDGADSKILDNLPKLLQFFDLYFSGYKEILEKEDNQIVSLPEGAPSKDYARAIIRWIDELIAIGWHLSIGETIKK